MNNKNQNQPLGRNAWWLDYVEGEFDPATKAEMKAILRHSKKDQEIVAALSETKKLIQKTEEELPILSDDFFDHLHDQIMTKVDDADMLAAPSFQVRHYHRRWARLGVLGTFSVLALVSLVSYFAHQSLNLKWDVPTQIAKQVQDSPDDLALFMTYQNEHDFFVDVASQSFDHLTDRKLKEQFENLIKSTKTR